MSEHIDNIQHSPIRDFKYAHWFEDVQFFLPSTIHLQSLRQQEQILFQKVCLELR